MERSQLCEAASRVWSAIFYRDEWPHSLQERADALQPLLFKYGTIAATIESMDGDEIEELRQSLIAFLDATEMAAS